MKEHYNPYAFKPVLVYAPTGAPCNLLVSPGRRILADFTDWVFTAPMPTLTLWDYDTIMVKTGRIYWVINATTFSDLAMSWNVN